LSEDLTFLCFGSPRHFTRIFFLHLRHTISRIVGVHRHLALAIRDRGHIAVVVVGVSLGVEERVFSCPRSIHVVVGVRCLLRFGIGDREQIAIGVVGKGGGAVESIRELRDAIQGIGCIERVLPEGVAEGSESPGGIENPLRLPVERILILMRSPRS